jgi:uncharacterized protein (DUF1800 family)
MKTRTRVVLLATFFASGVAGATAETQDDAAIVHVLNRLTYGPRPGDVEAVRKTGLSAWLDRQLHPDRIPDTKVAAMLDTLETHGLATAALFEGYELPREAKKEAQQSLAAMADTASEEERRKARREFVRKYAAEMEGSPRQVLNELTEAKLLRATLSERQLEEVLVDFWFNHFNVYAPKGPVKFMVAEYEREAIRKHAWGRFEDLLLATASSPAMLFYLDNWLSADPNAAPLGGRTRYRQKRRDSDFGLSRPGTRVSKPDPDRPPRGLNENYGREILELHTLGVDGGYSQKDVTEVARCFTGWTIRGLREGDPRFVFFARVHDRRDKVVLGTAIEADGQDEGRRVIHLLATHPTTARFIATKLVRRLVSDDPPPVLVDRAAATFRRTDGDIRAVVTSIVTASEFLSPAWRAAKVKTPLEFVVSSVRASGAQVLHAGELARRIAEMGMPLYQQQPPTGYTDTADAWVSTSGLLARLNFALDLAAGRVAGVVVDPVRFARGAEVDAAEGAPHNVALAEAMARQLVPTDLGASTRATLQREADNGLDAARVAGLLLGSPEFQRR